MNQTKSQKVEVRIEPVRKSVEVRRSPADTFRIFTEEIAGWWPLAKYSVSQEKAVRCALEGRVGGRLYEEDNNGQRYVWGTVTAWEPPRRLVFTWHPGRGADTAQEVEILFEETETGTRVKLEHRGWEALGEEAARTHEDYDAGWETVLGKAYVCYCHKEVTS